MSSEYDKLLNIAKSAADSSYVPYSSIKFGCALKCNDNKIYSGCKVEVANYGSSIDPIEVAFGQAIKDKCTQFETLAIYPTQQISGSCLQLMVEFNPNIVIIMYSSDNKIKSYTASQLLPHFFGPHDLIK